MGGCSAGNLSAERHLQNGDIASYDLTYVKSANRGELLCEDWEYHNGSSPVPIEKPRGGTPETLTIVSVPSPPRPVAEEPVHGRSMALDYQDEELPAFMGESVEM